MTPHIGGELGARAALRDLGVAAMVIGIGVATRSSALFSAGTPEAVDVVFDGGAFVWALWAVARMIAIIWPRQEPP